MAGDTPTSGQAAKKAPAKAVKKAAPGAAKAPAKKAPAKKAAAKAPAKAVKAPPKKAPAQAPAQDRAPAGTTTSAPATPAPERSWAAPHAATLSLPEPVPGVPIKKEHVAIGVAALFGLLLLRRRRRRRHG